MSKIRFTIEYAGLQLQLAKNDSGDDITPLKPISDLFGLGWERQRKKVAEEPEFKAFYGTCTVPMYGAGGQKRDETCILLQRVAGFLMGLSPSKIRAAGNVDGAEFLRKKQEEWADALHDYEQLGVAVNLNHAKQIEAMNKNRMRLAQLLGVKAKTAEAKDRALISHLVASMAGELGISYQPDIIDAAS
jgi:hypothetical protein